MLDISKGMMWIFGEGNEKRNYFDALTSNVLSSLECDIIAAKRITLLFDLNPPSL